MAEEMTDYVAWERFSKESFRTILALRNFLEGSGENLLFYVRSGPRVHKAILLLLDQLLASPKNRELLLSQQLVWRVPGELCRTPKARSKKSAKEKEVRNG